MAHTVECRVVNDTVWWKPRTWGQCHMETRRVWNMDEPLSPEETTLFIKDGAGHYGTWERVDGAVP